MTPFLIWLDKEGIDELISLLLANNKINKQEIFTQEELIVLTENLLEKNNHLIELIKKIKPLNTSSFEDMDCDKIVSNLERNFQLGIEPKFANEIETVDLLGCKSCLHYLEQN